MTPQPQPEKPDDEFRITRWQLEQIAKYADLERIVWACLNKPSRSAPEPEHNELAERECAINNCMRKDWLQRHDTAVAAQAREDERNKVLKACCNKCPVRHEEMPLEDYSAESCEGCLIRSTVESLREAQR